MLTLGPFLRTLTPEQEDRVLTRVLVARWLVEAGTGYGCLIGVAFDCLAAKAAMRDYDPEVYWWVSRGLGTHFNELCDRFGVARVSAAIRLRILQNRARRALQYSTAKSNGEVAVLSS